MTTGNTEREFASFVRTYLKRLYAVAFKYTGNRHLAEDVLQDACTKMWKAWPNTLNQGEALVPWAYTVIRNTAIDHHRKVERRKKGNYENPVTEIPWEADKGVQIPGASDCADEAIFRAMSRDLWAAVATLDEVQQDLIQLIYIDQWSLNRAGRALGLAGTTATRYHKAALATLRVIIGSDEEKEAQDAGR